jgi:hypothetical protein
MPFAFWALCETANMLNYNRLEYSPTANVELYVSDTTL